jgi:hypothetical protein
MHAMLNLAPMGAGRGSLDVVQLWSILRQPFDGQPRARGERRAGGFAGMDRAVVKNANNWLLGFTGARPLADIEAAQQRDAVAAALGGAGVDDHLAGGAIEDPEHRPLVRLPGRLNPQILAPLGPEVSEIGMGERFRLIAAQQRDVAGCGLLFQPVKAQPGAVNRVSIPGLRRGRLCRPLSVCRGRRQAKPLFSAPR